MLRFLALLPLLLAFSGCSSPESTAANEAPNDSTLQVDDLRFTIPGQWQAEVPSSPSRKAQYALTATAADDPGSCVIYYFGPGGAGDAQTNIDRWIGQFVNAAGEPPTDSALRETLSVDGLTVHTVDVSGRYVAEAMPGSGQQLDKPDQRLIAAVIEAPAGAYYLKVLGPQALIDAQEADILAMIRSMRHDPTGQPTEAAPHP